MEVTSIIIPLQPVPASRPRVTRYGTYYGKNYKEFKQALAAVMQSYRGPRFTGPLKVRTYFFCRKAKTSKRQWPQGDIDNYLKAVWDGLNKIVWDDDDQIVMAAATKQYIERDPHIQVDIQEVEIE